MPNGRGRNKAEANVTQPRPTPKLWPRDTTVKIRLVVHNILSNRNLSSKKKLGQNITLLAEATGNGHRGSEEFLPRWGSKTYDILSSQQGRQSERNGGLKGSEGETRIRVEGKVLLRGESSQKL